jgi:competence protein ComEC
MPSSAASLPSGTRPDIEATSRALRYQPLVVVAAALAVGICVDRYCQLAPTLAESSLAEIPSAVVLWWLAATCCGIAWWFLWQGRKTSTAAWLLLIAVASTGAAWHDLRWFTFPQSDIGRFAPLDAGPACVTATVVRGTEHLPAPQPTPLRAIPGHERSRVEIEASGIRDGKAWLPADGRCELLVDGELLGVHAGDKIQVFGQLERPSPPMDPGEFDFAANARAKRRLAILRTDSPSSVTVLQSSSGYFVRRTLESVRESGIETLRKYLPEDHANLAAAMLLGAREALPTEATLPYFLTGMIHLLVVSGLNVGILAAALYGVLRMGWLSRRASLALFIAAIIAYVMLTGARPPAIRAGLLIVLAAAAVWSGRRAFAFNSLALAALVVLAINPCDLFLVGPQLGFLCVSAIICVGDRWQRQKRKVADPLDKLIATSRPWYIRWPIAFGNRNLELLVMSFAVWIVALPLVLY